MHASGRLNAVRLLMVGQCIHLLGWGEPEEPEVGFSCSGTLFYPLQSLALLTPLALVSQ